MDPRVCEVENCDKVHHAKGLCGYHYTLIRRSRVRAVAPPAIRRVKKRQPKTPRSDGRKWCGRCGNWLLVTHFGAKAGTLDGLQGICRDCRRAANWRRRFNLSPADFERLLLEQENRCAICGTAETGTRRTWCVDHDHRCCPGKTSCGKCVRGLLCSNCNNGLGMLKDNPDVLRAATKYLEQRIFLGSKP